MCFIATGHGDDIETMAGEKQSESLTDGRLVVDDEHTGLVHRTGRLLRSERRGRPPGGESIAVLVRPHRHFLNHRWLQRATKLFDTTERSRPFYEDVTDAPPN